MKTIEAVLERDASLATMGALVYHGPGLARRIANGLAAILLAEGIPSISDAVGTERL